uniref:Uncharacterized protein n=1 Tax=Ditylenchus dipsaci TaxID=166011 RepID=A0A915EUR3_9BILA
MLLPQFGIEKRVRVCEQCFETNEPEGPQVVEQPLRAVVVPLIQQLMKPEKTRLQELMDKEAEELQLALAISQSERKPRSRSVRRSL